MPRPWKNSLCNCMPCGLCLKGTFCTCILVGQNHERITSNVRQPDTTSGWCAGWMGLQCFLGAGFILQMLDRMEMTEKYDLEGGSCGACCRAFCCGCCEAIQMKKELDYLQLEGGATPMGGATGYIPQGEKMVAQPQGGPQHY
ncbi:PLAC8 family-domain-containing protein [Amylocarpus encephaloides]|uniref:PLAC8 family-domain-containing protein n=1 Tax=Amylocarpus encephaloides TaxID=45428 RepID=A0A9P8C1L3_9HELO|nr:PLAC8 family-domain-containing protein [Amylocarpus encephaloides]